jgi:hypothetical protein
MDQGHGRLYASETMKKSLKLRRLNKKAMLANLIKAMERTEQSIERLKKSQQITQADLRREVTI